MDLNPYWIALLLMILVVIFCSLKPVHKEGFQTTESRYKSLYTKFTGAVDPFCQVSVRVKRRMREMLMKAENMTPEEANAETERLFLQNVMNLPLDCMKLRLFAWGAPESSIVEGLRSVPDDLALRMKKELDWYISVTKKLEDVFNQLNSINIDTFANPPTCSPAASQILRERAEAKQKEAERKKAEAEAALCKPLDFKTEQRAQQKSELESQMDRVEKLVSSQAFAAIEKQAKEASAKITNIEVLEQRAKEGKAFSWQKVDEPGTKKTYAQFKSTGDRWDSLKFSLDMIQ